MPRKHLFVFFILLLTIHSHPSYATPTTHPTFFDSDDNDDHDPFPTTTPTTNPQSTRYFFNLLDTRSTYGRDFFHDPLIGPDFDAETQIELDYAHTESSGDHSNDADAGFQWNAIGQLTLAGQFGYDWEHQHAANSNGFENVDLAIYHPFFQYVSPDKQFDYTAVVRLDIGIPTRTPQSGSDLQLTPYIGHLLRLGEHLSLEAWTGPQFTIAPNQTNSLLYGASFGYEIFHNDLPLPSMRVFTPIFELDGQAPFSSVGNESLFGVAGFDTIFQTHGDFSPSLELGYEFPIDQGARNQLRFGLIAQVFLEF